MTHTIGDWLLLDAALEPPKPTRSGRWRLVFEADGRKLYVADAKEGWVGAPWREFRFDGGIAWLFGGACDTVEDAVARAARGGDASELGTRFQLLSRRDDGSFRITTDRFGTRHAYALESGAAASSSFHAVSALSSRELDWPGLASFFACGFFLGDATFWRGVRCLAPARHHEMADGGSPVRYWRWRHAPERRSYDDTVDAFAEIFESAVDRATRSGSIVLPLSGGLDSRALAAAVSPERVSWSYGYGYQPGSVEVAIAADIARIRGLRFESLVVPAYLPERMADVARTVEGFQDVTQTRQLAIVDRLAAGTDAVLAGHWGDVWLDDMGAPTEGGADQSSDMAVSNWAVSKLRKRGADWLLEHLVRPRLGEEPDTLLRLKVRDALEAYGEIEETDFRFKAFKTDHWSWRWTLASVRAYEAGAAVRLPFYDPQLADFFATVPAEYLRDRRLEIDYLRRRAPDLASIPWQETGAGLHRSRRAAWWLGLPRRAVARAMRELRRKPVIERNWEVQLLGAAGRRLLEQRLLDARHSGPGLSLHDIVDRAEIHRLLEDFFAQPTASSGYTVSMLLTFAAALETSG